VLKACGAAFFATIALTTLTASAESQCEQAKRNTLAECLSEARDEVNDCQKQCEDPDDTDVNTCRRKCSEIETKERNACFAAEKATKCD